MASDIQFVHVCVCVCVREGIGKDITAYYLPQAALCFICMDNVITIMCPVASIHVVGDCFRMVMYYNVAISIQKQGELVRQFVQD